MFRIQQDYQQLKTEFSHSTFDTFLSFKFIFSNLPKSQKSAPIEATYNYQKMKFVGPNQTSLN